MEQHIELLEFLQLFLESFSRVLETGDAEVVLSLPLPEVAARGEHDAGLLQG